MTHECPHCHELWDCIYERCFLPRVASCFVCFSKWWHTSKELKK